MKKSDHRSLLGALGIMVFLVVLGFLVGGNFGAFVGGCFAYTTWWLKDINDRQLKAENGEKSRRENES